MPAMRTEGRVMAGTQWVRIDAGYLRNPKVRRVGRDGALLHLSAILYLGEHRIDSGLLPPEALDVITPPAYLRRPDATIARLVKAGLWHPDMSGGFLVHDYDELNGEASEAARDRYRRARERARSRRRREAEETADEERS